MYSIRFAHAFFADGGASCGEIVGHSKVVNTAAIRQSRPFRAVTGGDDSSLVFSNGVPFTFNKIIKDHTRFVQEVKFSNNGDLFASVGSDGKVQNSVKARSNVIIMDFGLFPIFSFFFLVISNSFRSSCTTARLATRLKNSRLLNMDIRALFLPCHGLLTASAW